MSPNYPILGRNNFDRVKDPNKNIPLSSKIFEQSVSFWYGERNGKTIGKLDKSPTRLFNRTASKRSYYSCTTCL